MEAEVTFLADTHVWIWFAGEERSKLSRKATEAFESGASRSSRTTRHFPVMTLKSRGNHPNQAGQFVRLLEQMPK